MESLKHKLGIVLLIICFMVILAAIWYLLFGISDGSGYEGGILVEGICSMRKLVCR